MEANILHFYWVGDEKGRKATKMSLIINNEEVLSDWDYTDGFTIDVPISGSSLRIVVKIGKTNYFDHTFHIVENADYQCELLGEAASFSGLKMKMSKPNEDIEENTMVCRRNLPVALLSFCFPIYGIYNSIQSAYNRTAALSGSAIGIILSLVFSSLADKGDKITFLGLEYEPFSFLDWIISILVGGIASLRGLLYMLLDKLF